MMLASPMFGRVASGNCEQRIAASAVSAACGPAPWLFPIAATSSCASRAAASAARIPPDVSASSSKVSSATIGRDETPRDGVHGGHELVEVEERLEHEEVDAAALENVCLLGVERPVLGRVEHLELAERANRAGDEDVPARDLTRLAGDPNSGGVDLLEFAVEQVSGELAAVAAERIRLDQLGAGADVARVHRDHALGRTQVRLLRAAQVRAPPSQQRAEPAVGHDRRAAVQPCDEVSHLAGLRILA